MPAGVEDRSGPPDLSRCERQLEYVFRDQSRLLAALTHASGASHRLASNERMEFLGDAILGMFVCELLYRRYPDKSEGDLTKIKSVVVSRQTCAQLARQMGLEEFLVLGKGMSTSRKLPSSLLAGAFESLVAAVYLDGGHEAISKFIARHVDETIRTAGESEYGENYKSLLQQWAQRERNTTPTYDLLEEKGPDHRKSFKVAARVGSEDYPPAWGNNKKEAEQRAALNALSEIGVPPCD